MKKLLIVAAVAATLAACGAKATVEEEAAQNDTLVEVVDTVAADTLAE